MTVAHRAVVRCGRSGRVHRRRLLADRVGDVDRTRFEVGIFFDEIVGQRGVEKTVDVHVVLDELVVALVVLSSKLLSVAQTRSSQSTTHMGFLMPFSSSSLL
jgi:hypothetical protein